MDDLRLTFLVFGILAIVAILIHGLWTIRKNSKVKQSQMYGKEHNSPLGKIDHTAVKKTNGASDESSQGGFDQDGVGQVRVLKSVEPIVPIKFDNDVANDDDLMTGLSSNDIDQTQSSPDSAIDDKVLSFGPHFIDKAVTNEDDISTKSPMADDENAAPTAQHTPDDSKADDSLKLDDLSLDNSDMSFESTAQSAPIPQESKPLYGSVVTQPKPGFMQQQTPDNQGGDVEAQPPAFLLKQEQSTPDFELSSDAAPKISTNVDMPSDELATAPSHVEPELNDTNSVDTSNSTAANDNTVTSMPSSVEEEAKAAPEPEAKGFAAQARRLVSRRRKSVADKIRKEPKLKAADDKAEEQMKIDFSTADEPKVSEQVQQAPANDSSASQVNEPAQQEVLVLHVKAQEDAPIDGAALLPMLLTLGLKFGEQDIFHRHVNINGKGQVLFSLANMFKPGHFDIDAMETFSTRGLALFMMLPIEGDPQQVFNMMHNASRKLAEEFGCDILDGARRPLSKQALQKYSEKIREFEKLNKF